MLVWKVAIICILLLSFSFTEVNSIELNPKLRKDSQIDPENIQNLMQEQVDIGPRYPGSNGSLAFKDWIKTKVNDDWNLEIQEEEYLGVTLRNYWITSAGLEEGKFPSMIFGAHYDSRRIADKDKENPNDPVPGANDGASGVAGILELMKHLSGNLKDEVGLVLFDAEDQGSGGMPGWSWIIGSREFVNGMSDKQINETSFFILFDMIANDEFELKYEKGSHKGLRELIWNKAIELGYDKIFIKEDGVGLLDDHKWFRDAGIPAVDIIDFEGYPEHHTTKDDMDNVSSQSVAIVVDVIVEWLLDNEIEGSIVLSTISIGNTSSTAKASLIFLLIPIIPLIFIRRKIRTISS